MKHNGKYPKKCKWKLAELISIWCAPLSPLLLPLFSSAWISLMHWSSTLECCSILLTVHFPTWWEWWVFQRAPCTLLFSSSQRSSIRDKSVLYGGQSSEIMLWLARQLRQTLATWCRVSSCCTRGTQMGQRTPSLYLTVLHKFPAITINRDFTPQEMPP